MRIREYQWVAASLSLARRRKSFILRTVVQLHGSEIKVSDVET
jgi:hypothetical protein